MMFIYKDLPAHPKRIKYTNELSERNDTHQHRTLPKGYRFGWLIHIISHSVDLSARIDFTHVDWVFSCGPQVNVCRSFMTKTSQDSECYMPSCNDLRETMTISARRRPYQKKLLGTILLCQTNSYEWLCKSMTAHIAFNNTHNSMKV